MKVPDFKRKITVTVTHDTHIGNSIWGEINDRLLVVVRRELADLYAEGIIANPVVKVEAESVH